jgi:hypothetical protein
MLSLNTLNKIEMGANGESIALLHDGLTAPLEKKRHPCQQRTSVTDGGVLMREVYSFNASIFCCTRARTRMDSACQVEVIGSFSALSTALSILAEPLLAANTLNIGMKRRHAIMTQRQQCRAE